MPIITIHRDEAAVAAAAAERLTAVVEAAIAARQSATVCLTGGRAAARLYTLLADRSHPWRTRIDWAHVHLFWGDERHAPPDHPDSNFGMALRTLLRDVPVPGHQVHRIPAELPDAAAAARAYGAILREAFTRAGRSDQTFDLLLLGLGADAHIASIFPHSPLLRAPASARPAHRVAAVWADHLHAWRITLTPPALLDARAILLLVSGSEKAAAVHAALELPGAAPLYPAQLLRTAGNRVEWIMDSAAAARWHGAMPS